jgi:hypothetical protein
MWLFLPRLFHKLFPQVQPRHIRRQPRYIRPRLEDLEERLVLDAYTFAVAGNPSSGSYMDGKLWTDLDNANKNGTVPTAADTADIPTGAVCTLSSTAGLTGLSVEGTLTLGGPSGGSTGTLDAVFASMSGGSSIFNIGDPGSGVGGTLDVSDTMTAMGGTLNVGGKGGSSGLFDVKTLSTGNTLNVYNSGQLVVSSSAAIAGIATVLGQIEAENIDAYSGAGVVFSGIATIGPGAIDGNLKAGIQASFTFAPSSTGELVAGATLGDGQYVVNGPLKIDGALNDGTADITVNNNGGTTLGSLFGPGSIDNWAEFNWTGGSIGLGGGITIEPTAEFKTSGPDGETLASGTITNISSYTQLGGSGPGAFTIDSGAIFDNAIGTVEVTVPSIISGGGMGSTGLLENTGGNSSTLDFQSPAGSPTVITSNFNNQGILAVAGGSAATLFASPFGGTYDLDGTLSLEGDLTLEGSIASPSGVIVNGGGKLLIGDSGAGVSGTLTVASGSMVIGGNVEVTGYGTLTGGGQVADNGNLTLDIGSAATIGSYQQTSTGTLALQATDNPMPTSSTLIVSGAAQLSGILSIDFVGGYTPTSGTVFTVLTAGSIGAHFDSVPPNMTPTYGPTSVTLTQD